MKRYLDAIAAVVTAEELQQTKEKVTFESTKKVTASFKKAPILTCFGQVKKFLEDKELIRESLDHLTDRREREENWVRIEGFSVMSQQILFITRATKKIFLPKKCF